mgnify:CR=1 FL=1
MVKVTIGFDIVIPRFLFRFCLEVFAFVSIQSYTYSILIFVFRKERKRRKMTFYLKRVVLELGEEGKMPEELSPWIAGLRAFGMEVIGAKDLSEGESRGEEGRFEALWITDDPKRAKEHVERGEPVLGCLPSGDAENNFWDVRYLAMDLAQLDADYLDKVYRRDRGIPWDVLETERCFLRETTEADVDAFYDRMRADARAQHIPGMDADIPEALRREMAERAGTNIRVIEGYVQSCLMLAFQRETLGRSITLDDIVSIADQK